MAEDPQENGNRATVALVSAQLSEVKTLVAGHQKLSEVGFRDVQRQLDGLTTLPIEVTTLKGTVADHGRRLDVIERDKKSGRDYRLGTLPMIVLALAGVALAVVPLVVK